MPAQLTFANEGDAVALIPTRYPGSETAADSRLVMARSTEWIERPGGGFHGVGQRLWVTDQGEHALMDVRTLRLSPTPDAPEGGGAA